MKNQNYQNYKSIIYALIHILFFISCSDKEAVLSKKKKIVEIIKITTLNEKYEQEISNLIAIQKPFYAQLSDEFWIELEKSIKAEQSILLEQLIPVYDEIFSFREINDLHAFLHTSSGSKFGENLSVVTATTTKIGQEWGKAIAQRITKEIEAKKLHRR